MASPTFSQIPTTKGVVQALGFVWDSTAAGGAGAWVAATPSSGGGGGAVTIADGADVAQGAKADAAWVAGSGTVISLLKKIASSGTGGGPATIADAADVTQGAKADVAWVAGDGTVISLLKKIASAGGGAVSVADGSDVTQGAIADVAVQGDTAGTISAKLRGLNKSIAAGLAVTNAGLTNLDVALSTRLKPADTLTAVTTLGTITNVVHIDDNAGSLTVDGTVTTSPPANASTNVAQLAGTATSVNSGLKDAGTLRVTLATDQVQLTNALKVDGSAVTQPVTLTSTTITGSVATTEATLDAALIAQEAATAGIKGLEAFGAVTTNAPTYTTGKSDALSLDPSGLLRTSLKDTPSNTNNLNVNLAASAATVTVSGTVTTTPPSNASTNVAQFGGSAVTIGQQLAGSSIPVILPSATITTLTPPAAITGFALEAGHLATIDTHIPAQGQALAANSVPVVLTAIQVAALTPPTNTGYALDSSLTTLDTDIKSNITLHAGTNVIGHVITDTGSTTAVTGNVTVVQPTGTNLHVVVDTAPTTAVTVASLPLPSNAAQETGGNLATLANGALTTHIVDREKMRIALLVAQLTQVPSGFIPFESFLGA